MSIEQGAVESEFLHGWDRGGIFVDGKQSYSESSAGLQITRDGYSWAGSGVTDTPVTVTYSFFATQSAAMDPGTGGFSRFNAQQIVQTELALQSWSDVANITFVRVGSGTTGEEAYSNTGQMAFGNYSSGADGAAGFAYYPGTQYAYEGDVWINSTYDYNAAPGVWNYGRNVLTHEIGHAIGLGHPGDYNAGAGGSISYAESAVYYEDSRQFSIMSYWDESNTGASFGSAYAAAPMVDDIAAAQRLYGVNLTTRTGDTVYGFNSNTGRDFYTATANNSPLIFAVWDAGGIDTFDFSGYSADQYIHLRPGAFSNVGGLIGNVAIPTSVRGGVVTVFIENAIGGSGADTMIGNSQDNVLRGGAGADVISGEGGDDTISGGAGDDSLDGGFELFDTVDYTNASAGVVVNLSLSVAQNTVGAGTDLLRGFEYARGSAFNDDMSGNASANRLLGLDGNDRLNGGDEADELVGGAGDDALVGGSGADILDGGEGLDVALYQHATAGLRLDLRLSTSQDTVGAGSDVLMGVEAVVGSNFDDVLHGNEHANGLVGAGGADQLSGYEGDDVLDGGAGADTLDGGEGSDTAAFVFSGSAVIVDLTAGATSDGVSRDRLISIENAIGSAFNDTFFGSAGANVLDGGTGGSDTLRGFGGSDTVSHASSTRGVSIDLAARRTSDGVFTDTLDSIENAIGSAFDDVLIGDATANRLDGGAGSDTVSMASATRASTVDLTAQATYDGFKRDTLVSVENAIGSGLGDVLFGSAGDNVLEGGLGADRINGLGGSDTVSFRSSGRGVTVDLAAQASFDGVDRDTLSSIENAIGSDFADSFFGSAGDNIFEGGLGVDRINGYGGSDTVSMASSRAGVTIDLAAQRTNDGADVDALSSIENAIGSAFDDRLVSGAGANRLNGGLGSDTVSYAGSASGVVVDLAAQMTWDGRFKDVLTSIENATGSSHADKLYGDGGANVLHGGGGADTLTGGAGADRFVFTALSDSAPGAQDRVTDFRPGLGDVIDVSAIDARADLDGNQAFVWAADFTGQAGQAVLNYDSLSRTSILSFDTDGDGGADLQLFINGQVSPSAGFVL